MLENILKFILGVLLIILGCYWFDHEMRKFGAQRKKEEYGRMSYTIQFMVGAFLLFAVGIALIVEAV